MSKVTMIPGTQLTKEDQAFVLSAYIHRWTMDHKPYWVERALGLQGNEHFIFRKA